MPITYDVNIDPPALPPDRQSTDPFIVFDNQSSGTVLVNFTTAEAGDARHLKDDGHCPTVLDSSSGEDLVIGALVPADQYPESYRSQRQVWLGMVEKELFAGTCQLHIKEIATCEPSNSNLYAAVTITGPGGQKIYTSPSSTSSPGQPINAAHSLSLQAYGLSDTLVITGEHTHDYIQFSYGAISWTSSTTDGKANCTLKGANWNQKGPSGCPKAAAIVSAPETRPSLVLSFMWN